MRRLRARTWEEAGSSAMVVHGETRNLTLNQDVLLRIEWHQGNPDAIAEILDDLTRPRKSPPKRRRSDKSQNRGKTIR